MKKESPSNPFEDLMYLRDSVFVTELKKLVVPASRDFSEHGTFDTSVFHDMCALGGAMVCGALIARHEDIGRFAAALDAKQGVEAAVGECPIFSLGYRDEVSAYPCLPEACGQLIASGALQEEFVKVITRMGELVLNAYAELPAAFDIVLPKNRPTALEVADYNKLVMSLSEKVYAGISRKVELSENGKKGAKAKAKGDGTKKLEKEVRVLSKKLGTLGHQVKGYRDEIIENRGEGVTVKSPANEKLIKKILDEYGKMINLPEYAGKNQRKAMTDAMRKVVDDNKGYIADFKDERSLRSELGREKAKWDAKYLQQATDRTVAEPDFGHK